MTFRLWRCFNSGRVLPPPSSGQCPKENIFFKGGVLLVKKKRRNGKKMKSNLSFLKLVWGEVVFWGTSPPWNLSGGSCPGRTCMLANVGVVEVVEVVEVGRSITGYN